MRIDSRTIVLIAIAAIAAMGMAVPSAALAEETALCLEDTGESPCPGVKMTTHVHLASFTPSTLLSSINVKCDVLFLGEPLTTGSSPLAIHGNFTYTKCGSCEVEEENGPTELKVLKEGHETASVTIKGLIHVLCSGFINCSYDGLGLKATAKGPLLASNETGEVTLKEQTANKEIGGFLCPKTSKLDLLLEPLSSLFYTESEVPPTSLCSKDEKLPFCKSENQLKTISYKDKAVEILTNLLNVKCEGLVSGSVGSPGNPLEVKPELTYTNCGGGCYVTSVAGPGKILLQREGKSEEAKATSEDFEIFVKCGTTIKCLLGPEKMTGTALGALATEDNGHLAFSKVSMGEGEGATCPSEAKLDALYVATSAAYIG